MIRPPQPSHGSIRFKMSTTKWCHTRVPKNGVSCSKHLLKLEPLPHQYWVLEFRTSLTEAGMVRNVVRNSPTSFASPIVKLLRRTSLRKYRKIHHQILQCSKFNALVRFGVWLQCGLGFLAALCEELTLVYCFIINVKVTSRFTKKKLVITQPPFGSLNFGKFLPLPACHINIVI